jgi:hypothetical protein
VAIGLYTSCVPGVIWRYGFKLHCDSSNYSNEKSRVPFPLTQFKLGKGKRYPERFDSRAIGLHMGDNKVSDGSDSAE